MHRLQASYTAQLFVFAACRGLLLRLDEEESDGRTDAAEGQTTEGKAVDEQTV